MRIEVDQSGKVENTQTDTVLAFSNGKKRAIIIPANLKRKWFLTMTSRKKPKRATYLLLFSACLFLLLKDYLASTTQVFIDREYVGHEGNIKTTLLGFFVRTKNKIEADQIQFTNLGKQSGAHKLALEVFRERAKADKTIAEKELFNLI